MSPSPLSTTWDQAWTALALDPPTDLREKLLQRYAEPQRAYHTQQHLAECLWQFERFHRLADRPGEVALALWYHDAVYDPRADDCEERSAALAAQHLTAAGAAADVVDRVRDLVLATKHEARPTSPDGRLVVDCDLAILAAPEPRFREYESQIRQEFDWVPPDVFARERSRVLRRFLDREHVFGTEAFRESFEAAARGNLRQALDWLQGKG